MNGGANALVSGANSVVGEAKDVQAGINRKISSLAMEQTDAQAQLDKTAFLNFGKKGTRAQLMPRCLAASLHTLPSVCRTRAVCLPSAPQARPRT